MRITSRIASALIVSALAHSAVVNAATIEASVVVIVCDYAGAGEKNVADAERTVSRIYRKAGVDIEWVDACNAGEGPALRLNMISTNVAADGSIAESALGYAAADTGIANIRLDRIIATSLVRHTCARDAMGPVIAHELAHLLLGPGAHHCRRG